jgi:hypothetical protein
MVSERLVWPPLEQWLCDTCGRLIEGVAEGYVEWNAENTFGDKEIAKDFHIVHVGGRSSLGPPGYCFQHQNARGRRDLPMKDFLGPKGIAQMLSFLDVGTFHLEEYSGHAVGDMREFVELFRRTQLPYYEQARNYFSRAKRDDFLGSPNEIYLFMPQTLKEIIQEYAESEE